MNNTANETVNTNETVNNNETRQPVDRTNEVLIDNETSFMDLLKILRNRPEAKEAAKDEAEEKEREEKEEKLRKVYGEDYDRVFADKKDTLEKAKRRPGASQLRTYEPRIARIEIGDGSCEVYANGYAVYDNGDRKTVLWVPDCGSCSYYFTQLRDSEKKAWTETDEFGNEHEVRMKDHDDIDEEVLGLAPWYDALIVAGENRIEQNLDHPKSVGTTSDSEDQDGYEEKARHRWICGATFPNPEDEYLKKEAAEERMEALTEKQRRVFRLYYEEGYKQKEIAAMVGIDQQNVSKYINNAKKKIAALQE